MEDIKVIITTKEEEERERQMEEEMSAERLSFFFKYLIPFILIAIGNIFHKVSLVWVGGIWIGLFILLAVLPFILPRKDKGQESAGERHPRHHRKKR